MHSSQGNIFKLILASLVLHALLIYLLGQRAEFSPRLVFEHSPVNPLIEPIKARLIFSPLVVKNPQKRQQQSLSAKLRASQHTATSPPAPKAEAAPPSVTLDIVVSEAGVEIEVEVDKRPEQAPDNSPLSSPLSLSPGDLVRAQLRSFQQGQINSLSQTAARAYQQQKTSPILSKKKIDHFISEDEKFLASRRITINCSTGTNKTASLLSYLFDGTLRCSQPPPIKTFIQNRLNKKAHLPAKYEPEAP